MANRTLTHEERLRLRPTVDVDALETLLNHVGALDRMAVISACEQDPDAVVIGTSHEIAEIMAGPKYGRSPSRIRESGGRLAFDSPELRALWDAVERPLPNHE